jgi:hypothetical protein
MSLHSSPMPDDETIQAPMYGPLVLAAKHEEAPRDRWYGEMGPFYEKGHDAEHPPMPQLPVASGKVEDVSSWVTSAGNQPLIFKAERGSETVTLVPINEIVHERYDVYWKLKG